MVYGRLRIFALRRQKERTHHRVNCPASSTAAKLREMPSILTEIGETFITVVRGFSVTFRNMWRKSTTENYPDERVHFQARYRGIHVLHRDENGLEKCVACFLCAAACPAQCIYIEAAENTAPQQMSAGDRYASVYNIDYSRCIFCGYCVEACPTDAITHGHGFELATYDINSLIFRKEKLLNQTTSVQPPANPSKGS
jgi:NADH-quinone oxidoreductase subunit I